MFRYSFSIVVLAALFAVACGGGGGGTPKDAPNVNSVTPLTGASGATVQFSAAISGGTPSSYAWNFGGGAIPNTSTTASPSVTLGTAGTYSCSITATNDGGSEAFGFTLTVTAAGGGDVTDIVDAGMSDLLAGDGSAAATSFEEALAIDPNNPEANFGAAYVDLMREANSIVTFLSDQNELVFRNVASLPMLALPMPGIQGADILDMGHFLGASKGTSVDVNNMTYEEARLEMVSIITVLDGIVGRLEHAINNAPDNWSFNVPNDWADPAAGTTTIIKADLLVLVGTLEMLMGTMHFAVAYTAPSLGITTDDWGGLELTGVNESTDVVDLNLDGFIDLSELALAGGVPVGDGVIATDGRFHLAQATSYFRQAILHAIEAADLYLALDAFVGHWAFDLTQADVDEFAGDWNSYAKAYAQDLANAFSGPTTIAIRPGLLADYPELADDPGAGWSVDVNFAGFYDSLPDDLRDIPVQWKLDEFGDLDLPTLVNEAFTDTTMLGLFPGGLSQENYERFFMSE